jgi:hypothetical protein
VLLVIVAFMASAPAQDAGWSIYRDPQGRFTVSYPAAWGLPATGTNAGFGNRVAALRFPNLPGPGGELALLQGRVTLDVQALGGLYDAIALEALPDPLRQQVTAALPSVTPANFCGLLGAADHLPEVLALPPGVRETVRGLDRFRNGSPRVARCDVQGDLVVFDKEATFEAPTVSTRQHIFGAVRFLPGPYSAVSLVRASNAAPSADDLSTLARVAQSFTR